METQEASLNRDEGSRLHKKRRKETSTYKLAAGTTLQKMAWALEKNGDAVKWKLHSQQAVVTWDDLCPRRGEARPGAFCTLWEKQTDLQ